MENYQSKGELSANINYSFAVPSLPIDHSQSKKRLFVRKPAYSFVAGLSDKKRKTSTEPFNDRSERQKTEQDCRQSQKQSMMGLEGNRPHRHTENFSKKQGTKCELNTTKQIFYSPRSSANDLFAGLRYIQKGVQNQTVKKQVQQRKPFIFTKSTAQLNQKSNLDETSDNSIRNPDSLIPDNYVKNEGKLSSQIGVKVTAIVQNTESVLLPVKIDESRCIYCSNTKKINQILRQKCGKLEEQMQNKNMAIKQLNQKIDVFERQKFKWRTENEKKSEASYQRQILIWQQCANRNEALKRDVCRLTDRVKYLQIQNMMLLRYKDQFGFISREYERCKAQNSGLKRQMNSISRMGQNFNRKRVEKQQIPIQNNKNMPSVVQNIYFKHMREEDDAISLELSDRSFEQF